MSQDFGHGLPAPHAQRAHREVTRYLVLIPAGQTRVARLFNQDRSLAAEFDATTEEVTSMTQGLSAVVGAAGPEWDAALAGSSAEERANAWVYALPA